MLKAVVVLAVAGFVGLVTFAYLGDLAPERVELVTPLAGVAGDGR
jgi:hypothetical protein